MASRSRRRTHFLLGFAVYFVLLWAFWNTPVVYPVQVFVVFLHEISHGLMAMATGGSIQRITLNPRLGGACYCSGGNAFLTLSAGYLGSLVWGGLILEAGRRSGTRAHRVTTALGVFTLAVTILFVRSGFGILFGLLFGGALLAVARLVGAQANRVILMGLGLTSCLYAILDIKSDVLDRPQLPSDARMLAELTGVPTVVWGVLWIAIAVVVSGWLLVRAFREA